MPHPRVAWHEERLILINPARLRQYRTEASGQQDGIFPILVVVSIRTRRLQPSQHHFVGRFVRRLTAAVLGGEESRLMAADTRASFHRPDNLGGAGNLRESETSRTRPPQALLQAVTASDRCPAEDILAFRQPRVAHRQATQRYSGLPNPLQRTETCLVAGGASNVRKRNGLKRRAPLPKRAIFASPLSS